MDSCAQSCCGRVVYAVGLCKQHYDQRRQEIVLASGRICPTPGCGAPVTYTRMNLCRRCYSRIRRRELRAAKAGHEVEASQAGRPDYRTKLQSAYHNATTPEARLRMRRLIEELVTSGGN